MDTVKEFSAAVIIPNYNDLEYLPDCLGSVLNQVVAFDQIIFVDDGSTDKSLDYVKSVTADVDNVQTISSKQREGTVKAINRGISVCACDYVLFLSANDFISANLVERFKATQSTETGFWSALCVNVSSDSTEIRPRKTPVINVASRSFTTHETTVLMTEFTNWGTGSTMFYNRRLAAENYNLAPSLKGLADWLLAIVLGLKAGVHFVPEVHGYVRSHDQSYLDKTFLEDSQLEERTRNYLEARLPASGTVSIIIRKVIQRVRLNVQLRALRHSSIMSRSKALLLLAWLFTSLVFGSGFIRLLKAKYIDYTAIYKEGHFDKK